MKKYSEILSKCSFFQGIKPENFETLIHCLNGNTMTVKKGSPLFLEGDPAHFTGVILSGAVQVIREDYYGNRSVLTILQPGDLFAEAFSCAGLTVMLVSAFSYIDSEVLFFDCTRILTPCEKACPFHTVLLNNLLKDMAQKNLALSQKIRYMSQKTTKEKLMTYLLDQAKQQGNREFVIPHDRQSLADYLGVERSAMSAEISKLKKSGQIDTRGSWFCLK